MAGASAPTSGLAQDCPDRWFPDFRCERSGRWEGFEQPIVQPGLGEISLEGPAFYATGMSDVNTRPAPGLGEHTREICRELLGMNDAEIDRLLADGALEGPLEED